MSLGSNAEDRARSLQKNRGDFVARTFALICCTEFHAVTKQSQMHPSITKCTKIWISGPLVQISYDCCEKFLRGTKFCINCTSSPLLRLVLGSKERSQIQPDGINAVKQEFRVQWHGSGAFIMKNFDATSWQESSHNCSSSARFVPSFVR